MTIGPDNFKWMLFGDDDTVFLIDNVLRLLPHLDPTIPYFMTDHLWYPQPAGMHATTDHLLELRTTCKAWWCTLPLVREAYLAYMCNLSHLARHIKLHPATCAQEFGCPQPIQLYAINTSHNTMPEASMYYVNCSISCIAYNMAMNFLDIN